MKKINNRGFSLVEILIVLGLIAGIVAYIGVKVGNAGKNAKFSQTKLMIRGVQDTLELYKDACDNYPSTAQGLKALVQKPAGDPPCESWGPDPYAKEMPKDAWGTELVYESDGIEYEIISYGANKRPGGEGSDGDISSKTMKVK